MKKGILIAVVAMSSTIALANPGKSAKHCLDEERSGSTVTFRNTCDEKIFVIYCGDLKYSSKKCGDGPGGGYYTHSNNIAPNSKFQVEAKGNIEFGACMGGVSFGKDEFSDSPNGNYNCKRTGDGR